MLPIKGITKTSLIDFPPYSSAVVFIGGCNFRCGFCHNYNLVLKPGDIPNLDEKELFEFLMARKKWLDAVVITGGEPTLYPELVDFLREVKKLGYLVKLDTNGTNPDLVWSIMEEKLIDYIAMDIKGPLNFYSDIVMRVVDIEAIRRSIALIMNSGIDYEFRATVFPNLLKKDDMLRVAETIQGAKRFAIQNFRSEMGVLDKAFEGMAKYKKAELEEIRKIMQPYITEVLIRD